MSRLLDTGGAALWVIGIVVVVIGPFLAFAREVKPGAGLKVMRSAISLAGPRILFGQERGAG